MILKQIRLKNFSNILSTEEFIIDFSNKFSKLAIEDIGKWNSLRNFFEIIPNILSNGFNNGVSISTFTPNRSNPFEFSIIFVDDDFKEHCYNSVIFDNMFVSESYVINSKIAIYCDTDVIEIGSGFSEDSVGEDHLIETYIGNKKKNFECSTIFKSIFSNKLAKFLIDDFKIVLFDDINLSKESLMELVRVSSKKTKELTRIIIPKLMTDIAEITEDWKIITNYDKKGLLSISEQGTGFKSLMLLLLHSLEVMFFKDRNKSLCILGPITGLHFLVAKSIINILEEAYYDSNSYDINKNSQVIWEIYNV